MWDQTLFKLASERPSEVTGMSLSISTSHSTAFGGKMLSARDQSRVSGSCIYFKIEFLTFHVGLPWWFSGKGSACNTGDSEDLSSIPGLGMIPWRRKWLPTSSFVWETPSTEEPGKLQLMGSQRVGHNNWSDWAHTCHVKNHPRLLSGGTHIVGSCHQNPWATSVIQHGHIGSRSLLSPSELGTVLLLMTCLFEGWAWTRGFFWYFGAQWPVDLHLKHSSLLIYLWGGWLNFLGPLGLSWGCNAWLTAIAISLWPACFHTGLSLPPQLDLYY